MSFTIKLGTTTKRKNSTLVPNLTGTTVTVLLKDGTSLIRPSFLLRMGVNGMCTYDELFSYNYCYCENFHRYYFITDIVMETATQAIIKCEVDVLASFRKDILSTKAFIVRAQSKTDITITDTMLGCSNSAECLSYEAPMTCGTPTKEGVFNLTVNCEGGAAQTGALTKGHLQTVGSRLYSSNVIDRIKDTYFNPATCLGGCTWTPFTATGSRAVEFTVGGENYGTFISSSDFEQEQVTLTPVIKYYSSSNGVMSGFTDFRNYPPYTSYYLYLPVAGFIEIDARKLIMDGSSHPLLYVYTSVCPRTGDITYMVYNSLVQLIAEAAANISYPVQISALTSSNFNAVTEIGGVLSAVAGIATLNPLLAAGGVGALISNDIALSSYQTSIRGSMGGSAADIEQIFKYRLITVARLCSDEPDNIRSTVGMPLQEAHVLGTMNGMVSCRGAYVACNATSEEHMMISTMLNGGGNLYESYGGVIIE